jgi:hypothetical protein
MPPRISLRFIRATLALLVAAIHVFLLRGKPEDVDGRNKSGHDGGRCAVACLLRLICYSCARPYCA